MLEIPEHYSEIAIAYNANGSCFTIVAHLVLKKNTKRIMNLPKTTNTPTDFKEYNDKITNGLCF